MGVQTAHFTTHAYRRAHGKTPSPRYGHWAFQRSRTMQAFEKDLFGEVEFFEGTLPEAKKAAKAAGFRGFVAVLP